MQVADILFLDDMPWRHEEFERRCGMRNDVRIWHVWSADEAIALLQSGRLFVQAFLDHDLSIDDIMVKVGDASKAKTGMAVVDFILTMPEPPIQIIVHSCNGPAREEMVERLRALPSCYVTGIPFTELIQKLR